MAYLKTFSVPLFIFSLAFIAGSFKACTDKQEYNYFRIQVDSLSFPEIVPVNEPFEVKFYGTVGTNGCYSFHRFLVKEEGYTVWAEVWGKLSVQSKICPDVMVQLRGEPLQLKPGAKGHYNLKVKQPDGTYMERSFTVK